MVKVLIARSRGLSVLARQVSCERRALLLPSRAMPSDPTSPPPFVPPFSPALEQRIATLLRKRLGRDFSGEELAAYRQGLWALATFVGSVIERRHAAKGATTDSFPSDPCPAPPSTPANQRNPTIAKS